MENISWKIFYINEVKYEMQKYTFILEQASSLMKTVFRCIIFILEIIILMPD